MESKNLECGPKGFNGTSLRPVCESDGQRLSVFFPRSSPSASPYARRLWYIGALASELGEKPVGRKILGEQIVFYRTRSGQPVAAQGLCPHRYMPLEMGNIKGDNLQCPYHGLQFAPNGKCVHAAPIGRPLAAATLRIYPVVEKGPFIWIWMGDAAGSLEQQLPPVEEIGIGANGVFRVSPGTLATVSARYSLLIDNLMDLSHLFFVHAASVGEIPEVLGGAKLDILPDRVRYGRTEIGPADALSRWLLPHVEGELVKEIYTDFYGPSFINTAAPWYSRPGEAPGNYVGRINFFHGITPAGPNETHYFGGISYDFRKDDDDFDREWRGQFEKVRQEDIVVFETIERELQRANALPREISMKSDEGGITARRRVTELIELECVGNSH